MLITNGSSMYGTVYEDIHKMAMQLKVGDCITFGSFVSVVDSVSPEIRLPMLWHVIDRKESKLKLLSYFFFEHTGYWSLQNDKKETTWENTEIRHNLNNKFYYDSFNDSEQNAILTTEVKTKANNASYIITKDKLYIPSLSDIEHIPEHLKIGRGLFTDHAENGIPTVDLLYCSYWLRDPGEFENTNLIVRGYSDSKMILDSVDYDSDEVGVRAVMWIDAEKIKEI